jgi:hypothetical protein
MQLPTRRDLLAVLAATIAAIAPSDADHCGADARRRDRLRAS